MHYFNAQVHVKGEKEKADKSKDLTRNPESPSAAQFGLYVTRLQKRGNWVSLLRVKNRRNLRAFEAFKTTLCPIWHLKLLKKLTWFESWKKVDFWERNSTFLDPITVQCCLYNLFLVLTIILILCWERSQCVLTAPCKMFLLFCVCILHQVSDN